MMKSLQGNVAEMEWKSTTETLQATLDAIVSEAATRCTYPTARNVACNSFRGGHTVQLSHCARRCVQ